jgi:hypothetical protein
MVLAAMVGCTATAGAGTWNPGDLITHGPANWGGDPMVDAGAELLGDKFFTVYSSGFLITGGHFTMTFTSAQSIITYEPAVGVPGPLTGSAADPISTASGVFGGDVLALQLNVDFSDAGFLAGNSGLWFGDLILTNFSTLPNLNGLTVRQFLADVNVALGGDPSIYSIADLDLINAELDGSFGDGGVSPFAQDHLVSPAAAVDAPLPGGFAPFGVLLCIAWALNRRGKRRADARAE